MFSRLNATQKGMILVIVPVVFQLLFIAAIYLPLHKFSQTLDSMRSAKDLLFTLQANEIELTKVLAFIGGSGGNLQGKEAELLEKLHQGLVGRSVWKDWDRSKNPELAHAVELGEKLEWDFECFKRKGDERWSHGLRAFQSWMGGAGIQQFFEAYSDQKELTRTVLDIERHAIAQQPEELASFKATVLLILWAGFALSVFVSAGLAFLFSREMSFRLSAVERRAALLAVENPGTVPEPPDTGTDEIAELYSALVAASVKLSEARVRQAVVLDNSADVICSLDARLKFSAVGAASSKVWGYSPNELLGQSLLNIVTGDTAGSTNSAFAVIRDAESDGKLENIVVCSNGAQKNSVWSVSWSAERKQFFCVVHDVTELRTIEKLKQHFLSVASHDLRAPLTSVTLNISIVTEAQADQITPQAKKELDRVQSSAQRLSSLVNELLELDKLEAGKLGLELGRVGVSDACEAAKTLLFGLARQSGVTLKGPIGDALVRAEEKRLVQIVTNLLSNAIKFSPKNGTVTMSVETQDGQAVIRVQDEGPGISSSEASLIFEKFSQARSSTQTEYKGTGLGLAVVKALVDSHGGSVGVDSELGKGSTFWVKLPLASGKPGEVT
ncbi:MAG TPA: PAS domain S-box protein [Candidatus Melainabacteria bacterium]|nr:PAS domain S-box protein [Candidatus Melainabacteria bacterium]